MNNDKQQPIQASVPKWMVPTIIIMGIIILILAISTIYLLAKDGSDKTDVAEEQKEDQQEKDEFKDWKTYRNEELGFEVKYPKDWGFQRMNPSTGADDQNGKRIVLWSKQNYKDYFYEASEGLKEGIYMLAIQYQDDKRDTYVSDPSIELISSEGVIVNGINGIKDKFEGPYGNWTTIYLEKNGMVYSLTIPDENQEQKDITNQIFSTFKFTD